MRHIFFCFLTLFTIQARAELSDHDAEMVEAIHGREGVGLRNTYPSALAKKFTNAKKIVIENHVKSPALKSIYTALIGPKVSAKDWNLTKLSIGGFAIADQSFIRAECGDRIEVQL